MKMCAHASPERGRIEEGVPLTHPQRLPPADRFQATDLLARWAPLALFGSWAVYRVFVHVPWQDELQAYLIARESTGLVSLFHNLAFEGHPALWHLILFLAAHVYGDPGVLAIVQAAVALSLLSLIWLCSPFGLAEKILLSLSYYLAFEYAVLARDYGLGVVLLFGFVVLRRSAWSWLLLGLMANVSLHFLVLAALCGCLQLYRGVRPPLAVAGFAVLTGLAVITAWPAPGTIPAMSQLASPADRLINAILLLSAAVLPANFDLDHASTQYWDAVCISCGPPGLLGLAVLVPLVGALSLYRTPDLCTAYLAFVVAVLAIGAGIYAGAVRHYGLVFVLLVALQWIADQERRQSSRLWFRLWILVSAVAGLWTLYWSSGVDFSKGRATAQWIRDQGLSGALWAAYPGHMGTDLSAWLGVPTYNLQARRFNTFMAWNYAADKKLSADELATNLKSLAGDRPIYLISDPKPGEKFDYLNARMLAQLGEAGVRLRELARFDGAKFETSVYQVSICPGDRAC